jgi:hypothetical protein
MKIFVSLNPLSIIYKYSGSVDFIVSRFALRIPERPAVLSSQDTPK